MKPNYLAAALIGLFASTAFSGDLDTCPMGRTSASKRYLAVISDLHIGNGRDSEGKWYRTEDFRWDGALRTFLDRITHCSAGRADLVIAGDLLELWQPLPNLRCKTSNGCTVKEMAAIAGAVIKGHSDTLTALREFARTSDNRIYVIPGNHDAALLLPEIWRIFHDALAIPQGRVLLVQKGLWVSPDGRVLIEHGHQIGSDLNRYDNWPKITRTSDGQEFIVQPWGENFVQSLFNEEEEEYPTIDNLSPETAGARYRLAERSNFGKAQDVARFLAFNLFETSIQQKAQLLGAAERESPKWDIDEGRQMGHLLFANALAVDDPFRKMLLADGDAPAALRAELDALARDPLRTPDAEIKSLCDQIAIKRTSDRQCMPPHLGSLVKKALVPRTYVIQDHLRSRIEERGLERVRVFIYGHTHLLEEAWPVEISDFVSITVLNSGAFQRVVDEVGFLARVEKRPGLTPSGALRVFQPEDLSPCYTAVLMPYADQKPGEDTVKTVRWYADENAAGKFVDATDARCN